MSLAGRIAGGGGSAADNFPLTGAPPTLVIKNFRRRAYAITRPCSRLGLGVLVPPFLRLTGTGVIQRTGFPVGHTPFRSPISTYLGPIALSQVPCSRLGLGVLVPPFLRLKGTGVIQRTGFAVGHNALGLPGAPALCASSLNPMGTCTSH